jgi:hypothetical protein
MSARTERLPEELERVTDEVAVFVEAVPDEAWQRACAAELFTVAGQGCHCADGYSCILDSLVKPIAEGRDGPRFSSEPERLPPLTPLRNGRVATASTGHAGRLPDLSLTAFHTPHWSARFGTGVPPAGAVDVARRLGSRTGLWQPTGERTATVTAYVNFFINDRLAEGQGPLTVEVDETGNRLTEEGTFVPLYEDGSVAMAFESPAIGIRLGIVPVEPLGTPVFPTEEAAAGTPAP